MTSLNLNPKARHTDSPPQQSPTNVTYVKPVMRVLRLRLRIHPFEPKTLRIQGPKKCGFRAQVVLEPYFLRPWITSLDPLGNLQLRHYEIDNLKQMKTELLQKMQQLLKSLHQLHKEASGTWIQVGFWQSNKSLFISAVGFEFVISF